METIQKTIENLIPKKLSDFLEKHRLSKDEYEKLIYQTQITDQEFNLIHAQATSKCIEGLKSDKVTGKLSIPQWVIDEIIENNKWIKSWVDDGFRGVNEAVEHLRLVNNWHLKHHSEPYWHALWLFDWQLEMREKIILKYKLGSREEIRAIKDKNREVDKITKRFGTYAKD